MNIFPCMIIREREEIMKELIMALCDKIQERTIRENYAENKKIMKLIKLNQKNNERIKKKIEALERKLLSKQTQNIPEKIQSKKRKRRLRIRSEDIISIRKRLGVSQAKFAELLGVASPCLNRWEKGKVKISQRSMEKIAPFRAMGKKELSKRLQKIEDAIWSN